MNKNPALTGPTSVKLEMTAKELEMMVYMLGAIDLRTNPETLDVALALRKKLDNAQKFFEPKNKPKKDKYGKPMSDEERVAAQALATQAAIGAELTPPQGPV